MMYGAYGIYGFSNCRSRWSPQTPTPKPILPIFPLKNVPQFVSMNPVWYGGVPPEPPELQQNRPLDMNPCHTARTGTLFILPSIIPGLLGSRAHDFSALSFSRGQNSGHDPTG